MVTTALPLLKKTSELLKEGTTDTSIARISLLDQAIRFVLDEYKWAMKRKLKRIPLTAGVQEYDLTSASIITDEDYDPAAGIYEIYIGGTTTKLDPIHIDQRGVSGKQEYSLSPDNKKITFTKTIDGTELYDLWYYAAHKDLTSSSATLNIPLPEAFIQPVMTYHAKLVHDGKRQRFDSRNKVLEYQEQIKKLKLKEAGNKARGLPKTIPNVLQAVGFRRRYRYN